MPSTTADAQQQGEPMVNQDEQDGAWRKSSYSTSGACFEVNRRADAVLVRDSQNPDGAVLSFEAGAFDDFIAAVKRGEFDRE
jgi:hypothetical protein